MSATEQLRSIVGWNVLVKPLCPKGHELWYKKGIGFKTLYKKYGINITTDQVSPGFLRFIKKELSGNSPSGVIVVTLKKSQMDALERKLDKKCRVCEGTHEAPIMTFTSVSVVRH